MAQICPRCGAANPMSARRCAACGESFASDAQVFAQMFNQSPQRAIRGRYVVQETLMQKRTNALYRVQDEQTGNDGLLLHEFSEIALLTGQEKLQARKAFEREVQRWVHLDHPALPQIVDAFFSREKHYLLLDVGTAWGLERLLRSKLTLDEDRVANWGAQLCELLRYLHHQDPPVLLGMMEPTRFVVTQSGLILLVDFKLGDIFTPERDIDPRLATSSPYAAYELRHGQHTPAADIYSLGMLLYALITHRLLDSSSTRPTSSRGGIPGASRRFEAAILRATQRDPQKRLDSPQGFRELIWGTEPITLQPLRIRRKGSQSTRQTSRAIQPRSRPPGNQPTPATASAPSAPIVQPTAAVAESAERPRLRVRPRRLDVELAQLNGKKTVELAIYNIGQVALEGRVISQVSWATVGRSAFSLQPRQAIKIPVTILGPKLTREGGMDPQALMIDSNAGRQWVTLQATIVMVPALSVPNQVLDFGEVQGQQDVRKSLAVANSGGGTLTGSVQSRVDWLQVTQPQFTCGPEQSTNVQVSLKTRSLKPGQHNAPSALLIDSDAGQARVDVQVRRVRPRLAFEPEVLELGEILVDTQGQGFLTITNEGDGNLDYVLESHVPWLQVVSEPQRCKANQRQMALITLDATDLREGRLESAQALTIRSNVGTFPVPLSARILAPKMALMQERIELGELAPGDEAETVLTVHNAGSAPLVVQLDSRLDWLMVYPDTLTVEPQAWSEMRVRADMGGLSRGQELTLEEALRIRSNGGEALVPLHLVWLKPRLLAAPLTLDFGVADRMTPVERQISIRNADTGLLEWSVQTDALWVEIDPRAGICRGGQQQTVTITAYGLALPPETSSASAALRITSNGGQADIPMAINMASPMLDVDVTQVDLGVSLNHAPAIGSVRAFNHGLGPLKATVRVASERLSVEPAAFTCETGMSCDIQVRANTEGLTAGWVDEPDSLIIESNGGDIMLDVAYQVALQADLEAELSPLTMDTDGTSAQGKLALRNLGGETAQVRIESSAPHLRITRKTCTIKPEKTLRLQVTWDLTGEAASPYFIVQTEEQTLQVPVRLEADPMR